MEIRLQVEIPGNRPEYQKLAMTTVTDKQRMNHWIKLALSV